MSSFYISAAHKSSGKTTISIGLAAALRKSGKTVQTFKKGPDYIDPIWLTQASGQNCHNLDFFTSTASYNQALFQKYSRSNDIVIVEGNMGLFDGLSADGSDSNASMAKLLGLPVVLVVDCSGTSRGIAPLLLGYQQFDPGLRYAGVILNKVAGARHEKKLREVIKAHTEFEVLGVVHRNHEILLTERHLGLIPSNEISEQSGILIENLARLIGNSIELEKLQNLNPYSVEFPQIISSQKNPSYQLRIAYAHDAAFGFYYPGDIDRFHELGVELVPFDTSRDYDLPTDIDGLFIGGGFPETQLHKLSGNQSLLASIKSAITNGLPTYAECGGLMYLCSDIEDESKKFSLCDVIPATVQMNTRPQGRGYVILEKNRNHPWYSSHQKAGKHLVKAHEFHYSSLKGLPEDLKYAYTIKRGTGIDGINDGIILHNMVASYVHLRQTDTCSWVDDFVSFVNRCTS